MMAPNSPPAGDLMVRIEAALDADPERPWCVHRLYEELVTPMDRGQREFMLEETERAAEALVDKGLVHHERISAISIGVHCQDSVYWSSRSDKQRLEEFGPEFQEPAVLRRLASHF